RRAHAGRPAKPQPVEAVGPNAPRWIAPSIMAATLFAAYAVGAQDSGSWAFTHRLAEHWIVKPISLALLVFPVTGVLIWAMRRYKASIAIYSGAWLVMGGWYVLLTATFL